MRFIPLAALAVLTATVAPAQEAWIIPFAAATRPDLAGFNAAFAAESIPQSAATHGGWGMELRWRMGGFLAGPMFLRTWDEAANDSFQLRTDETGIFFNLGPSLQVLRSLTIVPMVGIGGLNHSFAVRQKTGAQEFGELFDQPPWPGSSITMSPGMKLTGLAALELNLSLSTGSGRYGLELRGGYMYSPFALQWHLSNGAEVMNAPEMHAGGPFASVGIVLMPEPEVSSISP